MAARTKKAASGIRVGLDADAVLAAYRAWLQRQPLAARSQDAYLAQARGFVMWLAGSEYGAAALADPHVRDSAVRDYKRHMKMSNRWAPASVNQALVAIDNLYLSLAVGRPEVPREKLAQVAPQALEEGEQRRFLRIVEACPSARDRAMATVFFYAGLRLSELAALDVVDVEVSARRGRVKVRNGKGDAYREVPLNSACRKAINDWFEARADQLAALTKAEARETPALWLSRSGRRMTSRAVSMAVRRFAAEAELEVSARVLRHTFVTNLIRSGADVVLLAEIAGYRRPDTIRYSLPSQADRDAAVEAVLVEI